MALTPRHARMSTGKSTAEDPHDHPLGDIHRLIATRSRSE